MISEIIRFLLSNFTLTFLTVGLICSLVKISRHRHSATKAYIVESFLSYYCLWALGITYIYNAVMHVVFHKMAASFIGWPDSPFQLEVGFASLGMGIAGVLAFRRNFGLRLGLIIMSSTFLWGAATGHLYQISTNHNYAPGNAGIMLWTGLLQPVISLALIGISYKTDNPSKIESVQIPSSFNSFSFSK
jgi:hypothetical protein